MDLTTTSTNSFTLPGLPGTDRPIEFTRPNGLGIVAGGIYQSPPPSVVAVQRFDLNGRLQVTFPDDGYPPATDGSTQTLGGIPFLDTPDGKQIIVGTPAGLRVVTNDGQSTVRSIPDPPGSASCESLRWWSSDEVLLTCGGVAPSLWLQPLNGDPPTDLATASVGADSAWQLTSGVYVRYFSCGEIECEGVGRLAADGGSVTAVQVPGRATNQEVRVISASTDSLGIWSEPLSTTTGGFLEWLNPETGTATPLLGGPANGGSANQVLAVQPAPRRAVPAQPTSSPHFATPEAAMTYLAAAWNRNDQTELDHVSNPPARAALQAMHQEAVNLRLDHCTSRSQGDYICYFDHDYPAGTATPLPGGVGQAVFLVGPADTPGWYMTVFQSCG